MSESSMAQTREAEWQGKKGSIEWAEKRARELAEIGDHAEAHMVRVSPYYSAVKRNPFLAPKYLLRAKYHALRTIRIDLEESRTIFDRSVADLNVLASPLAFLPVWLGGRENLQLSQACVEAALSPSHQDNVLGRALPHDTALNWIRLAGIYKKLGKDEGEIDRCFREAIQVLPLIQKESDKLMAARQTVRIMFGIGEYLWTSESYRDAEGGREYCLSAQALALSKMQNFRGEMVQVSKDQARKIWWKLLILKAFDGTF